MTEYDGLERSTATDELRRLLDERGVEWHKRVWGGKHSVTTFWHARGVRWHYRENRFGELRLHADGLAPEQAIAATLGTGTCHVECFDDGIDEALDGSPIYTTPTWHLSCGHTEQGSERPNFCPVCGKAVDA